MKDDTAITFLSHSSLCSVFVFRSIECPLLTKVCRSGQNFPWLSIQAGSQGRGIDNYKVNKNSKQVFETLMKKSHKVESRYFTYYIIALEIGISASKIYFGLAIFV